MFLQLHLRARILKTVRRHLARRRRPLTPITPRKIARNSALKCPQASVTPTKLNQNTSLKVGKSLSISEVSICGWEP
jgi:hypothetical protein